MNEYEIEITETLQKRVIVSADSVNEALQIASKNYYSGIIPEYILDSNNLVGSELNVI